MVSLILLFTGLNYLVNIDSDGRLRWHRTGQLIDTTAGHWKDEGEGGGIVPLSGPSHRISERRTSFDSLSSISSSNDSQYIENSAAMHYTSHKKSNNWVARKIQAHLTLRGLTEKLLRKTIKRNTWIYVSV